MSNEQVRVRQILEQGRMIEIKLVFTGADLLKAQNLGNLAEPEVGRTVAFFDTAKRCLLDGTRVRSGLKLILRARFSPGRKRGKTTLKIRTVPGNLDDSLQTDETAGAKREFDLAYGRELLDSYSLDNEQDRKELEAALTGRCPLKSIFSDAQENLVKRISKKRFRWADLRIYGPVSQVLEWEDVPIAGFEPRVTFELWNLLAHEAHPAREMLELSTRVALKDHQAAVERLLQVLKQNGIDPSPSETKTKTVLDHFSPGTEAG